MTESNNKSKTATSELDQKALEQNKLNDFKTWYFDIIDDAHLRIIKDNLTSPGVDSKTSILSFLNKMDEEYIRDRVGAEYVRDYVASLTDELAIRI